MAEEKDTRSFNKRLMDAMAEMANPTKGKTAKVPTKNGGQYQYKYESLDQVLEIIDPALANHGLRQMQRQEWHDGCNSFVLVTIVFDDTEERIMDTRPIKPQADAQKDGSYETYMRRYALKTVFGLAGEDDDGAATKQQPKTAQKASGEQYAALSTLVDRMADAKGMSPQEVENAVMRSNAVKAQAWEKMTYQQAQSAINQLNVWIEKLEPKLLDKDIEF